ncbi:Ubiquitin [Psidium guajava]|nr:Ubiquitin [Psidium guajava]
MDYIFSGNELYSGKLAENVGTVNYEYALRVARVFLKHGLIM